MYNLLPQTREPVKTFSALTGDQTCFSTVHVSPFHRRHLLLWICLWSMPDLWTRSGFDSWKSSRMRSDSHCGQDLRKSLECRWTKLRRHLYQLAVYHWVFVHLSKDSILGVRSWLSGLVCTYHPADPGWVPSTPSMLYYLLSNLCDISLAKWTEKKKKGPELAHLKKILN